MVTRIPTSACSWCILSSSIDAGTNRSGCPFSHEADCRGSRPSTGPPTGPGSAAGPRRSLMRRLSAAIRSEADSSGGRRPLASLRPTLSACCAREIAIPALRAARRSAALLAAALDACPSEHIDAAAPDRPLSSAELVRLVARSAPTGGTVAPRDPSGSVRPRIAAGPATSDVSSALACNEDEARGAAGRRSCPPPRPR